MMGREWGVGSVLLAGALGALFFRPAESANPAVPVTIMAHGHAHHRHLPRRRRHQRHPRRRLVGPLPPVCAVAHPPQVPVLQWVPLASRVAGPRTVRLAIDTDTEFRALFGSTAATLDYVTALVDVVTMIYAQETTVRLALASVRLWTGDDPWTTTVPTTQLDELRAYWRAHPPDDPGDVVLFLSGKRPLVGGVAWVGGLCNGYDYGVAQVTGAFDLTDPATLWDPLVVAHELGHVLSSPHTHCYTPPLDHCYGSEPGCYDGAVTFAPDTILSYCHLLGPIRLVLSPPVAQRISDYVAEAPCLSSPPSSSTSTTTTTTIPVPTTVPPTSTTSPPVPTTVLPPTTVPTTTATSSTATTSTTTTRPESTSTTVPRSPRCAAAWGRLETACQRPRSRQCGHAWSRVEASCD